MAVTRTRLNPGSLLRREYKIVVTNTSATFSEAFDTAGYDEVLLAVTNGGACTYDLKAASTGSADETAKSVIGGATNAATKEVRVPGRYAKVVFSGSGNNNTVTAFLTLSREAAR
ncbi:MAG: hypothetical protein AMXMBFR77_27910 [Phycisphaerales bacterium]